MKACKFFCFVAMVLVGVVAMPAFSQNQFFKTLGGTSRNWSCSVVKVFDRGLVVAGGTESYGAGNGDLLLAKFDASGNSCSGEFVTPVVDTIYPSVNTVDPTVTSVEPDTATWDPTVTSATPTITVVCEEGVEHGESFSLPHEFPLSQNYPNPFNSTTEIKYALPRDCYVQLDVLNILGQKVAGLVDGEQKAGYKTVRWDVGSLASGIYFCRLKVMGDRLKITKTRQMILLK